MAGFVQIIEFRTSRIDEVKALAEQMQPQRAAGPVTRGLVTEDRDNPGTYRTIVEFPSHAEAMENSARPETDEFAQKMAALCDDPPRFYNLDVVQEL